MNNCPQCGGDLLKSERLKRYYCDDCGYKISIDEFKEEESLALDEQGERLTVQEIEEINNDKRISENLDKAYITHCASCGGEFVCENGKIFCKECGKVHQSTVKEKEIKIFKKNIKPDRTIGFICPFCEEKYSVVNGEIYCKTCDAKILEDREELQKDRKFEYSCPKCTGEYAFDETTGKIACKTCGYQPPIENKEYVVDTDNSGIISVECDKCGSNSGYSIVNGKVICKSCGDEINREVFEKGKRKKYLEKDGIVAKRLTTKEIKCKNCGGKVVGFSEYKTEICENCGTINVVVEEIESLRLEPNKIIPYLVAKDRCEKILEIYSETKGLKIKVTSAWKKVYVPFWHFHYEGAKYWYKKKRSSVDEHNNYKSIILFEGKGETSLSDIWISGREEFIEDMSFDMNKIDMGKAVVYTPETLDTMTERYNVGTAEASVLGQDKVYDYIFEIVSNKKEGFFSFGFNDIELNFGTYVDEFEQVLIPTWQNLVEIKNEQYFICINGQNGEVKIAGLDLAKKVQAEKVEEALDRGSEALGKVFKVLSWLDKG